MSSQTLTETPIDEIPQIRENLRRAFYSGKAKTVAYRKEQLLQLAYLLKDNWERFRQAFFSDLGRPPLECDFLELSPLLAEVTTAYSNVKKWAATERTPFSPIYAASGPAIRKEPKGVVLIISPFNFPLLLLLGPLAGAIAAGNAALLKPSELNTQISTLLAELIPKYLDPEMFAVVNGGIPQTTKILDLQWDHILYTGGGRVAKIVSAAAAQHLTPVSTELGGKSPVVIDPKCDLKTAARRILWGAFSNAGQICATPDYVLVPRYFQDTFVDALQESYAEFYPTDPRKSDSLSRIITTQHTERLKRLLDNTKGKIVAGGEVDVETKYVAPTIVRDVGGDDSLMNDEVFGPILPIVPVEDVDEAIEFIRGKPHPLVLYVFSKDAKFKAKVFDNTQSGAAIANETLTYIAATGLPFGGTGPSGSGYHTGKFSFDMFTHLRATMDSPSWLDSLIMWRRFPPYTEKSRAILLKVQGKSLPPRPGSTRISRLAKVWKLSVFVAFLLSAAAAWARKRK
ncbi:aldehyde dehydrogenase [Amylocystis lapponica]|nr:aldehyde dehydrogenase [Amylocystis lapponica]